MKTIATVNTELATKDTFFIDYNSGKSFLDYDIILFNPKFPYSSRIEFSGGGSCVAIEDSKRIKNSMNHWNKEIQDALRAGKTVFFLLNDYESDSFASNVTIGARGVQSYNTYPENNYSILPRNITVRNANGKQYNVIDSRFKVLKSIIDEIINYRVILTSSVNHKIFVTKNGEGVVGAIIKSENVSGNLVLLPYFDISEMTEVNKSGKEIWTKDALRISKGIIGQLVEIDKILRQESNQTPAPNWIVDMDKPKQILNVLENIDGIKSKIVVLEKKKDVELKSLEQLSQYSHLLYETGIPLEAIIEKSLKLLEYKVENYRNGDLEIDHLITSPEGLRMIGESEGKDNSAIDISKFRQLESNIGEDLERDDVEVPAKGLLFGNGFRLTEPSKREEQFTRKCLINAKRLNVALIRTMDLYKVVVYILDNPDDKSFKKNCREAIENTNGDIVNFPVPV